MKISKNRATYQTKSIMLLFMSLTILSGQKPDWVSGQGQSGKYSRLVYLTGYGVAHLGKHDNNEERKQQAVDAARKNLIEQIQVQIRSESTSNLQATNVDYSDYYGSTTVSSSSLEIWGLEASTYYERKKKLWHALVATRKDQLLETYRRKAEGLAGEIEEHFEAGKSHEAANQPTDALAEYLLCYPLFDQLQGALSLMFTVSAVTLGSLDEVPATPRGQVTKAMLREAVDRLIQRPIKSPEDLAWSLAYKLGQQVKTPGGALMTTPLTFQDTRIGSPFARFFQPVLDTKLHEVAGWGVVPQSPGAGKEAGPQYVLKGTYWQQPDKVKLMATVRRVRDGAIMASAEAWVANEVLTATGLDLKPQNFTAAMSDQKHFRTDEVIGGGLMVDVWTDRGAENLLYTDGEILRIYLRVNVPSYIRMIYHFADGTRTLLMDSHYIDETKVNKVYQLPDEFECAGPFGPEVLQVFARTEPFEKVETVEEDGYYFLKEDLPKFLARTRGIRKKKRDVMQAERRVRITTLAKEE